MRRRTCLALILVALSAPVASKPKPSTPVAEVCPTRESGDRERYLVSSEKTAKAIFLAVEGDYYPRANRRDYPDVLARDMGSYWQLLRWRDPTRDRPEDGEIILQFAGHQLSIQIDKCTAAISKVYFNR